MNTSLATFENALLGAVQAANGFLWDGFLAFLLLGAGIWLTVRIRFFQATFLGDVVRLLSRRKASAAISPFQAFCLSTGARVGVGNIAGIAIAIAVGGPGAIFWMWVSAFFGAATGFFESTAAQLYKHRHPDGTFTGGPAAYMRWGCGVPTAGLIFALLLAVSDGLIFNSVLSNTLAISLESTTGSPRWLAGVILAAYAAWVAFAGAGRLAGFSVRIVPLMLAAYLLLAAASLVVHFERLPEVVLSIVQSAFTPEAAGGAGLWFVMMTGIRRGLYSNEAGQGTVPNAAAAAQCRHPVEQGIVQAAGVYVDTFVICTATAFIVLLNPAWAASGETGVKLVEAVLRTSLGDWSAPWLFAVVCAFALTSVIGNFFYSDMALRTVTKSRTMHLVFRLAVIGMVFLGSVMSLELAWNLADLFMGVMTLLNLAALAYLCPRILRVFAHWKSIQSRNNPDDDLPAFRKADLPAGDRTGIEAW